MQILKRLSNYFLLGVLALLPIVVVIQIVLFLKDVVAEIFFSVYGYSASYTITLTIFSVTVVFLVYVGYRVKHGKAYLLKLIDRSIEKIPFLNTVYRVTKKLMQMLGGHEEPRQREVVYIEYPKEDVWVPGYITNRSGDMFVVYVPTSPNPTSGFTVIVHESKMIRSMMNLEEVTGFVVSVGVDFPREKGAKDLARLAPSHRHES